MMGSDPTASSWNQDLISLARELLRTVASLSAIEHTSRVRYSGVLRHRVFQRDQGSPDAHKLGRPSRKRTTPAQALAGFQRLTAVASRPTFHSSTYRTSEAGGSASDPLFPALPWLDFVHLSHFSDRVREFC